ncbi:hypothetical protein BJI67_16345 (plasmid) [Acidihalobacter aeolianus]|uniref:Nucleoside 2-deoxyribosyltransferase n=1 Tax=Acidihalobacter aeolianus TaxID=2792603 RepID=A0A1D8KCW3_9GAMM|nr:nucleoside 2-deoxyribosyltransferase [Acidihalobacter aeolianus]AOV18808.1 hypothetical protein BJI67_16345 [Acidihalobacter aeolianus]
MIPNNTYRTVYLAGPDLFYPDADARFDQLKALCLKFGLRAISPIDAGALPTDAPATIRARNLSHIRQADGVLANLAGFRGPEPDSGTVYEVGFAAALNRVVVAYNVDGLTHYERVQQSHGPLNYDTRPDARAPITDKEGIEVEDFGLRANLMLAAGHLIYPYTVHAVAKLAELVIQSSAHLRSQDPLAGNAAETQHVV